MTDERRRSGSDETPPRPPVEDADGGPPAVTAGGPALLPPIQEVAPAVTAPVLPQIQSLGASGPGALPDPSFGIVPLRIEVGDIPVIPDAPRKRFWAGTTDDCPFATVHCVVDFPRFEGRHGHNAEGMPVEPPSRGRVHMLTEASVKEILRRISHKIVRFPNERRAEMRSLFNSPGNPEKEELPAPNPKFRPMQGDTPLGKFVFLVQLEEGAFPDRSRPGLPLIRNG